MILIWVHKRKYESRKGTFFGRGGKLVETLEKSSEYNQNMLTIYENEIGTLYIFKSHTN